MPALPQPLPYLGLEALGAQPHVIVDGAPRLGSVCVLSHWPVTTTPPELACDLSAEIAFAYLRAPEYWAGDALAVTNDHFDADGLSSVFALAAPDEAVARERQLVDLARVGDFGVAASRDAARVSFALGTLTDSTRSPFAESTMAPSGLSWTTRCYTELLAMLTEILDNPGGFQDWWEEEDATYGASLDLLASGGLQISEDTELSLAVITLDEQERAVGSFPLGFGSSIPVHPVALNTATSAPRVLLAHGHQYWYYDRYETWVRYVSRELPLRRDLVPLAIELTGAERSGATWSAGSPNGIEPVLALDGDAESALDLHELLGYLRRTLSEAPPAFDPFASSASPPEEMTGGFPVSEPEASTVGTSGRARARWRDRWRARPST